MTTMTTTQMPTTTNESHQRNMRFMAPLMHTVVGIAEGAPASYTVAALFSNDDVDVVVFIGEQEYGKSGNVKVTLSEIIEFRIH